MPKQASGPKTILIVDDEMDMRIFMRTLFETSGYRAVLARDGKEGLQKVKEIGPDLIVLDVMMPSEGGVLMYRNLKTDPLLARIPVIMLSAVGEKSFGHYLKMLNLQSLEAIPEPACYLEKPPDSSELLKIAESLLRPAQGTIHL
jgi:CheY-like chemotaxis protein